MPSCQMSIEQNAVLPNVTRTKYHYAKWHSYKMPSSQMSLEQNAVMANVTRTKCHHAQCN